MDMTEFTDTPVQDPAQVMEATEGFVTDCNGERFVGVKGRTRVSANHPIVKQCPNFFSPVEPMARYTVEEMTANPGERRHRPRGRPPAVHTESESSR